MSKSKVLLFIADKGRSYIQSRPCKKIERAKEIVKETRNCIAAEFRQLNKQTKEYIKTQIK